MTPALILLISRLRSLQYKGLSRVFSNTTVQSINSLVLSFLYSPTLTSIHVWTEDALISGVWPPELRQSASARSATQPVVLATLVVTHVDV